MRYHALAADYDGTIAHHGAVDGATLTALRRLRESGRKLVLVTGRELPELLEVFPEIAVFDRVVAENGALLYRPETREELVLAEPPRPEFVATLRARGVDPISVGRSIVATWEPHQDVCLATIRDLGLELQVIFNKGAVMILPSGVNKATGLTAALAGLRLSPHNVVGVGDAENDHAFLSICEAAVAVANALDALKDRADWVTPGHHGAGVAALVEALIDEDLASLDARLTRHHILLGEDAAGAAFRIPPYGINVLVAGTSGSGKSTLTTALLERLHAARYQFMIVDPEGDYTNLDFAVDLGDADHAPPADGVIELLEKAELQDVSVNLLGIPLADRPGFSDGLLPRLQQLRSATGRPHWIVIDEAHHLLPSAWDPANLSVPYELRGTLAITVHPESVARAVLERVDLVLAVGEHPEQTVRRFGAAGGRTPPRLAPTALARGEALAWWTDGRAAPLRVRVAPPTSELRRHSRKYALGNLGPDRSFYFRGPDGKLNLRAQNLVLFLQLADGVDDPTWLFHLQQGDYARWLREQIKDEELAEAVEQIAAEPGLFAAESRARVRAEVERRYTLPTEPAASVADPSKFG